MDRAPPHPQVSMLLLASQPPRFPVEGAAPLDGINDRPGGDVLHDGAANSVLLHVDGLVLDHTMFIADSYYDFSDDENGSDDSGAEDGGDVDEHPYPATLSSHTSHTNLHLLMRCKRKEKYVRPLGSSSCIFNLSLSPRKSASSSRHSHEQELQMLRLADGLSSSRWTPNRTGTEQSITCLESSFDGRRRACPMSNVTSAAIRETDVSVHSNADLEQSWQSNQKDELAEPSNGLGDGAAFVAVPPMRRSATSTVRMRVTTPDSESMLKEAEQQPTLQRSVSVTLQQCRIECTDLQLESLLGQGASSVVHRGTWLGHVPVAVKSFHCDSTEDFEAAYRSLIDECKLLSLLSHENVLRLRGVSCNKEERKLMMVSELFTGGSLATYLAGNTFCFERSLHIALCVARALRYMHHGLHLVNDALDGPEQPLLSRKESFNKHCVLHRDLKSANVLVNADVSKVVVADFGVSKLHRPTESVHESASFDGTPDIMAPELLEGKPCTKKSDVFAFAILLYEIFTHRRAWGGMKPMQIMFRVHEGLRPPLDPAECAEVANIPPALRDLMHLAWNQDPALRPSFETIVKRLEAICVSAGVTCAMAAH
ncbi:Serine/threonine-protein kinase HT1 [Porphyridium purpureum]|uniref:Serine/threonine-protein kinase HT1 n=1 Tax=Porphyridium purpureum TaxID=35688 RepID=A0A5J4YMB7_PORPP|nr:Serine/threonine-protein kinase HT1 [Porphyridium purpureum]|eukprot:POR9132..scf295_9